MSLDTALYDNHLTPAWCPGCGNFAILKAVKRALAELELAPHQVLLCSGIGQAPKLPHYLHCNMLDGLHGREVASATGAKLAAPDLTVLVHSGDGGAYGEGGNHFLAAIRRNIDLTHLIHDNRVYGLTKGQASPTTEQGTRAKLQPRGLAMAPLNPLALAISQGCSFVAQGFAGHGDQLVELIKAAVRHRGYAVLNILQPCVSWDQVHTYKYYEERCFELPQGHDPADRNAALALVLDDPQRYPLGVIYRNQRPPYEDAVLAGLEGPLRDRPVEPERVLDLLERFR